MVKRKHARMRRTTHSCLFCLPRSDVTYVLDALNRRPHSLTTRPMLFCVLRKTLQPLVERRLVLGLALDKVPNLWTLSTLPSSRGRGSSGDDGSAIAAKRDDPVDAAATQLLSDDAVQDGQLGRALEVQLLALRERNVSQTVRCSGQSRTPLLQSPTVARAAAPT